jgi:hypothetical protein
MGRGLFPTVVCNNVALMHHVLRLILANPSPEQPMPSITALPSAVVLANRSRVFPTALVAVN